MSKKILIIDSDEQVCEDLSELFKHDGYEVTTADDADIALKTYAALENSGIDAIIIEPVITDRKVVLSEEASSRIWKPGLEVLDRLYEHYGELSPVIIFTTQVEDFGKSFEEQRGDFQNKPYVKEIIAKPSPYEVLKTAVEKVLK